jgi:hypothetical protein
MDLILLALAAALLVLGIGPFNRFIDRWNEKDPL